jgi:hypothetical protein
VHLFANLFFSLSTGSSVILSKEGGKNGIW